MFGMPGLITAAVAALLTVIFLSYLALPRNNILALHKWPSVWFLYLQALLTIFTKVTPEDAAKAIQNVPDIEVSLTMPCPIDAKRFEGFMRVAKFSSTSGQVPLKYPIVESFRLVIQAMLLPAFPFKILGSVLARNTTTMHRAVDVGESLVYSVTIKSGSWRTTAKGDVEVDITATASSSKDGTLVWTSITTAIILNPRRPKSKPGDKAAAPTVPATPEQWQTVDTWQLGSDTGRRYGMLNGDLNPIHLYPATSQLFGFKRPIAHALYLVARSEAALRSHGEFETRDVVLQGRNIQQQRPKFDCKRKLTSFLNPFYVSDSSQLVTPLYPEGVVITYPATLATDFKRPTLLPATLVFRLAPQPSTVEANGKRLVEFAVTTEDGMKPVVTGTLS